MVHWKSVKWSFLREAPFGKTLISHGILGESLRYSLLNECVPFGTR